MVLSNRVKFNRALFDALVWTLKGPYYNLLAGSNMTLRQVMGWISGLGLEYDPHLDWLMNSTYSLQIECTSASVCSNWEVRAIFGIIDTW